MKIIEKIKIEQDKIYSLTCDKCGKSVRLEYLEDMTTEIVSFSHIFGYGTDLDGTQIEFELCKDCLFEKLSDVKYRKTNLWG